MSLFEDIPWWVILIAVLMFALNIWLNFFGPCSKPVLEAPAWCIAGR